MTREELIDAMLRGVRFAATNYGACPVCGKQFQHKRRTTHSVTCGDDKCRRTFISARESQAVVQARRGLQVSKTPYDYSQHSRPSAVLSRRCHDCGKPTNDYRCTRCLAKWRQKYNVRPYTVETAETGEEL